MRGLSKWAWRSAIVALSVGAIACGDDARHDTAGTRSGSPAALDDGMTPAERLVAERKTRALAAGHVQSDEERAIARKAERLQSDLEAGDYAAVCAQLAAFTAEQLAVVGTTCADGLRRVAQRHGAAIPLVAWVRVRGEIGNVMVMRRQADDIDLSPIVREKGRWMFSGLALTGLRWP